MVKFKDFSRSFSVFQVLFKANLFSRTFQDSLVYSSTFQACANPGVYVLYVVNVVFVHKIKRNCSFSCVYYFSLVANSKMAEANK